MQLKLQVDNPSKILTAITKTLQVLKKSNRHKRVFVVMEFASYTMRTGVHTHAMANALSEAYHTYILESDRSIGIRQ